MGKLFTGGNQESKEARAVLCVNALQGIPEEIVNSEAFQDAMRDFRLGKTPISRARTAACAIRQAMLLTEARIQGAKHYERKWRMSGRVNGLDFALRKLKEAKVL